MNDPCEPTQAKTLAKPFRTFLLAGVLLLFTHGAMAQPPPPSDPNNVAGGAGVPIDGGLSILLAAGAGLGLKKAWDTRKSNKPEEATDEEA